MQRRGPLDTGGGLDYNGDKGGFYGSGGQRDWRQYKQSSTKRHGKRGSSVRSFASIVRRLFTRTSLPALTFLLVMTCTSLYVCYQIFYVVEDSNSITTHSIEDKDVDSQSRAKGTMKGFDPSEMFCSMKNLPVVCAHGGDSTFTTPNTKKAFAAALRAQGVDCVEVDLAVTLDKQLYVLHRRELSSILSDNDDDDYGGGGGSIGKQNKKPRGSKLSQSLRDRPANVEEFHSKELGLMRVLLNSLYACFQWLLTRCLVQCSYRLLTY